LLTCSGAEPAGAFSDSGVPRVLVSVALLVSVLLLPSRNAFPLVA
jgi:hypothetical protein